MTLRELRRHGQSGITDRLFFRLLPIQALIIAMGAVNSIVDGAVAGRYIDAGTVGVIGLYFTMVNLLNAIGNTLLGGTAVLCGRHMGEGNFEKTKGLFSLNILVTFLIGAVLTAAGFLFSGPLAALLGASAELKPALMLYITGYSIGIVPQLLAQQLASFLQMERQGRRSYLGIAAMILTNVAADILLVAVLRMGVFGLALATALSNWIYFLILAQYYLTEEAQLRFDREMIDPGELVPMIVIGAPGALLVLCLALRGLVLNRILLAYAGSDGLSAMSAYNMVSGIFLAYCIGAGAVVRMLASVYFGERDAESLKGLFRTVFTRVLAVTFAVTAAVLLLTGPIARVFFPDTASGVYQMAKLLMTIYAACIPLILFCSVFTNYMQASGHHLFVNIVSVFDGFFSNIIPTLLLLPVMGVAGIWAAGPIGIVLTMLLTPAYCILYWRRRPRTLDEWLFLKPGFDAPEEDRLARTIATEKDVAETAATVQEFCRRHGMGEKISYYTAICLEEMTANVVKHGFHKDKKPHTVDVRVIRREDGVLLRIKDDCVPFNPKERAEITDPEDPLKNFGVRMVMKLADEVSYSNMLGLNVLTMILASERMETETAPHGAHG